MKTNRAGIILLALSVLCLILGISRGEAAVVFGKAAIVCMECIGLG